MSHDRARAAQQAMEAQIHSDGVDYLRQAPLGPAQQATMQAQQAYYQRQLDRESNWGNYQPQNDPIARIEAKLDRILAAIGDGQIKAN